MTDVSALHHPVLRDEVVGWLAPAAAGGWIIDGTVTLTDDAQLFSSVG